MLLKKKLPVLWCWLAVFCQAPAVAQGLNFSFRHVNAPEMLPENHVKCFFSDSTGFVWFGTRNGLVRFDGVNMETFQNTPKNVPGFKGYNVNKILKDKNGNFWIGTDFGVNFYDVRKNVFRNYPLIPDVAPGLNNMCYSVPVAIDEKGRVWLFVATKYALYILDPQNGRLTLMPCLADLECGIDNEGMPGKKNKIAFRLLRGAVLYDIDNGKVMNGQQYFSPQGKFQEMIINEARFFFAHNDSIVWITCDRGLIKLNYKNNSYKLYKSFNNAQIGKATNVCFYNDIMFVASAYNGLFIFDPKKDAFTGQVGNNPFDPNSLASNKLSRLFVSGNNLFVSFEEGGFDFTSLNTTFAHYVTRNDVAGLNIKNQVACALGFAGGEVLLGTYENGMLVFNTTSQKIDSLKTNQLASHVPARHVNHITANGGYTAVASGEGLFVFKSGEQGIRQITPVVAGSVNYAAFFNDTILLATNDDGLLQVNVSKSGFAVSKVKDYYKEENSKSLCIYPVKTENIVYVMAEYGSYLHEMEFDGKYFHIKRETWLTQDNIFVAGSKNDSSLLLCGSHGIIEVNRKTLTFSSLDGRIFSNKQVYAVLQMKNNNWFVVYNKGAAVYNQSFSSLLESFDEADGLYNTNFSPNSCRYLPNGDILLGGNDGVYIYHHPDSEFTAPATPPLYIADIKVNDGTFDFGNAINYVDSLRLNHNENTISLSFSAIDYTASANLKLEYMLEGIDNSWLPAQHNGFARYASLRPGTYTFKLRNYGAKPGGRLKTIYIFIGKPFWYEWWFILACVITFFFIAYLIYLYRIQELIRIQNVRDRIATDLHDDIGSTLTNINILAELSSVNINNSAKAAVFIQRISQEVTATSESLDDIVWSINTSNDSFNQMAARMRRYAAELFEHGDVKWEVAFDENMGDKKLAMDERRDIYLIFKEAVNNIHKHACAKHVKVAIQLQKGRMAMQISDDGKGFDPVVLTHGNGVKNMHARAAKWKGTCNITSHSTGTVINIVLPLAGSSPK